ncbi:hypothetical protein [Nitrospirillum viridazoti]|uniref:Uncharacterized protein n=1 Tax=Nitrospirillum amazonense TaxID=28077 RepID=A0A560HNP9_9PROT|nr:hypothetical protein [Nitrospirillum amazonense]TWB47591.1 hypothetical protein FBZ92_13475 [Nitrospirillum amazonense]
MTKSRVEAFREAAKNYTAKMTASREVARDALQAEGVYRSNGTLTPAYSTNAQEYAGFLHETAQGKKVQTGK